MRSVALMRSSLLLPAAWLAGLCGCAIVYDYEGYQRVEVEEEPPAPPVTCAQATDCEQTGTHPDCLRWECLEGRCVGILSAPGTHCGPAATCQDDVYTPPHQCDGQGTCPTPTPRSCASGCSGDQCSEGCTDSTECSVSYACDTGSASCFECLTCARWLADPYPMLETFCPGSEDSKAVLEACACQGDCAYPCASSHICGMGVGLEAACNECLDAVCGTPKQACTDDHGHGG